MYRITLMNKMILVRFSGIVTVLYFLFFFLAIFLVVNPAQSYFIQQPLFLFDKAFFWSYLEYPGGLIQYISMFLSQFYVYPLLGALIITVIAASVFFFTDRIMRAFDFNRFGLLLKLAPVTALFYLHGFSDGILTTSLILLFTLKLFYYYLQTFGKTTGMRLIVFLFFSLFLFYVAGGCGLLLFQALCFFAELVKLDKSLPVLFLILLSALFPYLAARFLFFITPEQSYFHLLVPETYYAPRMILYVLYIYYPLLVLFCNFMPKQKTQNVNERHALFSSILQIAMIGILTCLSLFFWSRSETVFTDKIKYLAHEREWKKILDLTDKHYSEDRLVNFNINRALYFTNRLPDDLFKRPNFWGQQALFLGSYTLGSIAIDNSELFFDLGHIRAARQWAYEAQTIFENSPRVLKMLAFTNVIEGDYKAASTMLEKLDKSIVHKKWAQYYLNGIQDTTVFHSDSLIQEKRRMMPSDVHFMNGKKVEVDLFALLKKNPHNKMAFEFLMAYLMLSDQIEKLDIADQIFYLKQLGYKEIPEPYQEALWVYISRKRLEVFDLGGYQFSPGVENGFNDYLTILQRYNMDRSTAQAELYQKFGSSYWYYQQYISPYINNVEFQKKIIEQMISGLMSDTLPIQGMC